MTTPNALNLHRSLGLFLVSLLGLAACGASESEEGSSSSFFVGTSEFGVAAGTPLAIEAEWLAFLADEAASGASQLNDHDTDTVDEVAVVVNIDTRVETNLRVAARGLQWVGDELYIVVDEVLDNFDWDGNTFIAELVLLRWHESLSDPVFVDVLDRNSSLAMVGVENSLFYASATLTTMANESSLFAIDSEFPTTPRPVFTQDAGGGLTPRLLGEQDGLILMSLDETVAGDNRDLNADTNADDSFVLALLDGTGVVDAGGYTLNIRNTGLAIEDASAPLRAVSQGANDWLVGFLVNETAQELSLNRFGVGGPPASWQVGSCLVDDLDLDDDVLHVIQFSAWDMDPVGNPPINSGLAGGLRVLICGDAVGTICAESDEGGCIFNNDGDSVDSMLRWLRIDGPAPLGSQNGPIRGLSQLVALDTDLNGPTGGAAEVDGIFVIQCDEVADDRSWDGDAGLQRDLVAWMDPLGTLSWKFNHSSSGTSYTTATWMGEQPGRTRLGVAYAESSNSQFLNPDNDKLDSVPTFADFLAGSGRLSFPGFGVALDSDNAGITLSNGWGFFRVSESEEGADINGNGTTDDILLVRLNLTSGSVLNMGALNTLTRPSVESEDDGISFGAAYLFDETILGFNISGDSDASDLVVRYFELP